MTEREDDPLVIAAAEECMRTGKMVRAYRDETGEYINVVEERPESLAPDSRFPWRKFLYVLWIDVRHWIYVLCATIGFWLVVHIYAALTK